jgi:hypothetical protein
MQNYGGASFLGAQGKHFENSLGKRKGRRNRFQEACYYDSRIFRK